MSDAENTLAGELLIRSALEHLCIRLRTYDRDSDTIRVKRKFAEDITKHIAASVAQEKSSAYWRGRAENLIEENKKLREKLNNSTACNWQSVADALRREKDALRREKDALNQRNNENGRLISLLTRSSRKWRARAQEYRARLEKAEHLNQTQAKSAVYHGESWRHTYGEKMWREKIKNIDTRLRAWSATPCDSTDELRAMAVLVESIKSAARTVVRAEEE